MVAKYKSLRLTGHEAKAIEGALNKWQLLAKDKNRTHANKNNVVRRAFLSQILQSGLVEFRNLKVVIIPGVYRFTITHGDVDHMHLCAEQSIENGWDKTDPLKTALQKLKRALSY